VTGRDGDQRRRVLVVDDHPLFRNGLCAVLRGQDWVGEVAEAATVADAVREAQLAPADVVAMDLRLPDGDGIEATERILRARPGTAVLLLTMVPDEDVVARALRAGARGYVLKESDPDHVVDALRTVAGGGLVLGSRVSAAALAELQRAPAYLPAPFDLLTAREREVVAAVAAGRSNDRIARSLGVSEKTVRNVVSGVLGKVQAADRVELALLARDAGLVARQEH
jgi:DNA-binding NarL/FixJ family response regulator